LLPHLRELSLHQVPVKDEQLRYLGDMPKLEVLDLSFTMIGGAGLAHLKSLPRLQRLHLRGCWLGTGVGALAEVPALRELDLGRATLDAAAAKQLPLLVNLHTLTLPAGAPHVNDWYREQLKALPDLRLVFDTSS
jgi:hypothetical protein